MVTAFLKQTFFLSPWTSARGEGQASSALVLFRKKSAKATALHTTPSTASCFLVLYCPACLRAKQTLSNSPGGQGWEALAQVLGQPGRDPPRGGREDTGVGDQAPLGCPGPHAESGLGWEGSPD